MIEIVSATRSSQDEFWSKVPLGVSLRRLANTTQFVANITAENCKGLPELFNSRITAADSKEYLVFIHDDVWIDDYFFAERIIEGLNAFDVIGVAGNRRRLPHQPTWALTGFDVATNYWTWDSNTNWSGKVAHGNGPFGTIRVFGAVPAECELLDGVLLAARKSTLQASGVGFDQRFNFHFYDMDFCRTARSKGLRLGTWPICITHQSNAPFGTPSWLENYTRYKEKWRD